MKPTKFQYHAPAVTDGAVGLVAEHVVEAPRSPTGRVLVPLMLQISHAIAAASG